MIADSSLPTGVEAAGSASRGRQGEGDGCSTVAVAEGGGGRLASQVPVPGLSACFFSHWRLQQCDQAATGPATAPQRPLTVEHQYSRLLKGASAISWRSRGDSCGQGPLAIAEWFVRARPGLSEVQVYSLRLGAPTACILSSWRIFLATTPITTTAKGEEAQKSSSKVAA